MIVVYGVRRSGQYRWIRIVAGVLGFMFVTCIAAVATGAEKMDAFAYNRLIGRGINLANALNAPKEGDWGIVLKPEYFAAIKAAGFNSVRIPIRWSGHSQVQPPFTIDPVFFKRVDWTIEQALSHGLVVIINVQNFDEMDRAPRENLPRLVALWQQIASRYRASSDRLYFELLNEPHGKLTDEIWQDIVPDLLRAIRPSNPARMVVVGPGFWNNLDHLDRLQLPESDRNLIVTFHYYSPMAFTHQGTEWVAGSAAWKGTTWTGSRTEREVLAHDFAKVAAWGRKNRRPIYLGEFGSYEAADIESRLRWTRAVVDEAKKQGFSWAFWQFGTNFAAYDLATMAWRKPILQALMAAR